MSIFAFFHSARDLHQLKKACSQQRSNAVSSMPVSYTHLDVYKRQIPPSLQPVPLTPEEQEELRKREERKDRLHQNYLKRKASGAQKRYEDKIKAKKKAEMDAKKALIRAEDMKKGVFSTIGQLPKEEPRKGSIAASAAV